MAHFTVSQMTDIIYDSRFNFNHDNPFDNDANKQYLTKLKRYLASNQSKFTEIDWYEDSRYLILRPDLDTLFGVSVNGYSNSKLTAKVKSFLLTVPSVSQELRQWCNESTVTNNDEQPQAQTSVITRPEEDAAPMTGGDAEQPGFNYTPSMIPTLPTPKFAQNLNSGMHYDISTDRSLSYEDVCKLCLSIARAKLVESGIPKDETVEALERTKRKELTNEIMRYKNNKLIGPLVEGDLSGMSLEQLETTLEQCKAHQEHFKTQEMFKRGFSAGGIVYDMVFPEGIPLGKGRRLQFKGIGKELLSTLFNTTTTTGIAFENIIRKNNIHVTDELLTLVAFGEICMSKVEIKKVEPKDPTEVPLETNPVPRVKHEQFNGDEELMELSSD